MRIEIAGALACGKTTVAAQLESYGFKVVYEDLSTNPYLDLVRQDPEKYALLCQQKFFEDKLNALRDAVATGGRVISDYCLTVERAYQIHYLASKPDVLAILERQLADGIAEIGNPDAIVYLKCRPETQIRRIRMRGREFEQEHDLGFIETIDRLVDDRIAKAKSAGIPVLQLEEVSMERTVAEILVLANLIASGKGTSTKISLSAA